MNNRTIVVIYKPDFNIKKPLIGVLNSYYYEFLEHKWRSNFQVFFSTKSVAMHKTRQSEDMMPLFSTTKGSVPVNIHEHPIFSLQIKLESSLYQTHPILGILNSRIRNNNSKMWQYQNHQCFLCMLTILETLLYCQNHCPMGDTVLNHSIRLECDDLNSSRLTCLQTFNR